MIQSQARFYLQRRQTQSQRLRGYLERTLTGREAAKEVRVFGLEPALIGWWEHLYWKVADLVYRQRRRHYAIGGSLSAFSLLGLAAGVGWSAWAVLDGGLSAGQFAAMIVALRQVRFSVDQVFGRMGFLSVWLLNIADLFIYLDLGPEEPPGGKNIAALARTPISARSLCFRYPQADRPALEEITFTILPGERVALVGANGSGKTTLVKILLGLFRPTAGELHYGSLEAERVNRHQFRDQAAAVLPGLHSLRLPPRREHRLRPLREDGGAWPNRARRAPGRGRHRRRPAPGGLRHPPDPGVRRGHRAVRR